MSTLDKYKKEGNSDELSKKFHDRAWGIASDLNMQLLNLSTGITAAIFFLAINNKDKLTALENIFILFAILMFGISILLIIFGKQWDASKNYFLGLINDSTKQTIEERGRNEKQKRNYDKKQQMAKQYARYFFLLGLLMSILFLTFYLF